jgi:hypothetical protein
MPKLLAYSDCMRSHGIADFPDPTPGPNGQGGGFQIKAGSGSDLNPSNPTYAAANKTCEHLLPYGGSLPKATAQQLVGLAKLASCMRDHGYPDFPDPNGQGAFVLNGIDTGSTHFQSAMQLCQSRVKFNGPIGIQSINHGPPPATS